MEPSNFNSKWTSVSFMASKDNGKQGLRLPKDEGLGQTNRSATYSSGGTNLTQE